MANSKISALTALTGANVDTAADLLAIVDTSASTDKKILVDELRNALGPVSGTKQASTSGTSIDFTSVPSWVKKITVQLTGVSTNGTSALLIQLGDAGGVETSGYLGSISGLGASSLATSLVTTGLGVVQTSSAAAVIHGQAVFTLEDSSDNTWVGSGIFSTSDAAGVHIASCTKATSAALDRVRITTVNGSDTFDAGEINVLYE